MTEEETQEVKDPQALLAAYNKAKEDLIALRDKHKELESKLKELNEDKFRLQALAAETKLALHGQGIKDADRLMPYIGTDGLDFDDEGKVTGLTERLAALKKDLPEVFDPKVRAGGKADIYQDDSATATQDPFRQQIHAALSN